MSLRGHSAVAHGRPAPVTITAGYRRLVSRLTCADGDGPLAAIVANVDRSDLPVIWIGENHQAKIIRIEPLD